MPASARGRESPAAALGARRCGFDGGHRSAVADRLPHYAQGRDERHAVEHERAEGAAKARGQHFLRQPAQDGQPEQQPVEDQPDFGLTQRLDDQQSEDSESDEDIEAVRRHDMAEIDEELRRGWELGAVLGKQGHELRQH